MFKSKSIILVQLFFKIIWLHLKISVQFIEKEHSQNWKFHYLSQDAFLYKMPSNQSNKPGILQEKVSNISLEYYKQVWNFIKRKGRYQLNRYCYQSKTIWNWNFLILFKIKRKIQEFNMLFQPMWNEMLRLTIW